MSDKIKKFDTEVKPLLLEAAKKCGDLNVTLVYSAEVEDAGNDQFVRFFGFIPYDDYEQTPPDFVMASLLMSGLEDVEELKKLRDSVISYIDERIEDFAGKKPSTPSLH